MIATCLCGNRVRHRTPWAVWNERTNPLKLDPTRTTTIRKRFEADIKRRFRKLENAVWKFVVEEDALGLAKFTTRITLHQFREFAFRTDAGKLQAFNDWVKQAIEANIISTPPSMSHGPWTGPYLESAYKKGQLNAYLTSKGAKLAEAAGIGQQSTEGFLRSAFGQPEAAGKVQLLATRALEDLKGVSSAMASKMNKILAQGMLDGSNPKEIASEMVDSIRGLTKTRALLIARTETIAAHAEGQLDSFEQLGIKDLGIKAEWTTAGDERVCPECAEMEGEVFDVEEARGLIPLHPNCRCSWTPSEAKFAENRFTWPLIVNYNPDQPRDERGRWTDGGGGGDEAAPPRYELEAERVAAIAAYEKAKSTPGISAAELEHARHRAALAQRAIRRDNKRIAKAATAGLPTPPAPKPTSVAKETPIPHPAGPAKPEPTGTRYTTAAEYRQAILDQTAEGSAQVEALQAESRAAWDSYYSAYGPASRNEPGAITQDQLNALREAASEKGSKAAAAGKAHAEKQREVARELLREKNSLADHLDLPHIGTGLRDPMKDVLSWMPADAFTEEQRYGINTVTATVKKTGKNVGGTYYHERDHFDVSHTLVGTSRDATIAHEFAHHISYKVPEIMRAQNAFFEQRTQGEKIGRLPGYGKKIQGKKDKFSATRSYAGRVYSNGRHTEIIAVGVELLHHDAAKFAKADPEYFDAIVRMIKGLK